jgi:hypothetical protein
MNEKGLRPGGNDNQGSYIWLRYSTQFTTGGRTHTIEMGVPMPLGASAETREQLLREAEAGMSQLSSHIEQRVAQVMQRTPSNAASPSPRPAPASTPRPPTRPATVPAPQTSAQPAQPLPTPNPAREGNTPEEQQQVSPRRQSVGASMPLAPISNGMTGNVPLREFLQYIKENFDLDPKQAMTLLKVKSLNDINRRDALEQLQQLMQQEGKSPSPAAPAEPTRPVNTPPSRPAADDNSELFAPSGPTPIIVGRVRSVSDEPLQEPVGVEMIREKRPAYSFDEEVGPEEEELDELDELDLPHELTAQEQTQARNLLSRLRESRGATAVSPLRLQVLHNVAGSQLSSDQLQALIEGVWNVNNVKRLKVDQAEALISWAKEDDFVIEAEAVLTLLEEEFYARGNR